MSLRKVCYDVFTGQHCKFCKTYCLQRHVYQISLSSS